jgi:gliding motility-associated-like protein
MKYILYITIFALSNGLYAQKETSHWFFGFNGGLDFSSGIPLPESGSPIATSEGTASISDPVTGNLLFYTDGTTVYDATHSPMPNGSGLNGCSSSTQAALIVPQPGSNHIYYIFTNDCIENNGLLGSNYSIVDMNLHSGLGDVTASKNILLHTPCSEQLCAVKHANCEDWWIMTKELNTNVYRLHCLTSAGLLPSVNTAIGLGLSLEPYGQAKFSPDGAHLAAATGGIFTFDYQGMVQLFDFDNSTGLLSNPLTILDSSHHEDTYGLSFSSDNSKLYIGRGLAAADLYQYTISSGVPATILASATNIGSLGTYSQLQLARDFKIYISNASGPGGFSVIDNPNTTGTACGLSVGTITIAGSSFLGVCNFPDSYFNEAGPCNTTTMEVDAGSWIRDSCGAADSAAAWITVTNGISPYAIVWSPGGYTNDTVANIPEGTYTVTVTDSAGNVATGHITISFTDELCDVIIPNIITANGDGINDVFKITGLPPGSTLHIYNRWGNPVFKTESYNNDWSSTNDGVYFYILKTSDKREFKGFVQLSGN